jgi:hypothetical protein
MKLISEVEYESEDGMGCRGSERFELIFEQEPDDTDRKEIRDSFNEYIGDMTGEYPNTWWEDECDHCCVRNGDHLKSCYGHPDFNPDPSPPEKS